MYPSVASAGCDIIYIKGERCQNILYSGTDSLTKVGNRKLRQWHDALTFTTITFPQLTYKVGIL